VALVAVEATMGLEAAAVAELQTRELLVLAEMALMAW
jgi:hypothetical protein